MKYINGSLLLFLFLTIGQTGHTQNLKLVIPAGHSDFVNYASFTADSKYVATASFDNTARVWDVVTGRLLLTLNAHTGAIWYVDFSKDQKYIITASNDGTATVWNRKTGDVVHVLHGHSGPVLTAMFSSDGKKIITASYDHTAKIWDAITGNVLFDLKGHDGEVYSAWFNTDETRIITASDDRTAKIWDASNGNLITTLIGHTGRLNAATFSPDGKKVLTSSFDGKVNIWDWQKDSIIHGYTNIVRNIPASFNKSGEKIVFGGDTTAFLCDAMKYEPEGILNFVSELNYANFSNDGNRLVFATQGNLAFIFDCKSKKTINLIGHKSPVRIASFSPNNKYVVTCSEDNTAKLWDATSGKLLYSLSGLNYRLSSCDISPDGKKIAIGGWDSTARIMYTGTATITNELKLTEQDGYIETCKFSHDGSMILTGGFYTYIWNTANGKVLTSLGKELNQEMDFSDRPYTGAFSPDDKTVATISPNGVIRVWSVRTKKKLGTLNINPSNFFYSSLQFSSDGNTILTPDYANMGKKAVFSCFNNKEDKIALGSMDSTAIIIDARSKQVLFTLAKHRGSVLSGAFSHNDKYLLTTSLDGTAKVWNVSTGAMIHDLKGHMDAVFSGCFSMNDQIIYTCSWDGTLKIWGLNSGNLLATIILLQQPNTICLTPKGYYMCSPQVAKLLYYVTDSLQVVTFQQLDVKFNRPDKVLQAIGNKDTALIQAYHNAYLKRIERLKIDTTKFEDDYSIPTCDFTKRGSINSEQSVNKLPLYIEAKSDKYLLDRFNLWINEVPLYGINGISLKGQNKKSFDTTISVSLSDGGNRIEASVFDENATESYRSPLLVNYTNPNTLKTKTWFIGIGVNQYKNHPCRNLSFAAKDIKDLDTLFKKNTVAESYLFLDSNATRKKIMEIKNTLMRSGINDKVVIALSGHGLLNKGRNFYFGTYDINFNNPEERGLRYEDIVSLLDDIPARKKLLLIDACHSGEIDTSLHNSNSKKETVFTDCIPPDSTKKGGDPGDYIEAPVGLENSFELMKEMFVDLSRGNGAVVISAARGLGFAEEDKSWQNGAFTLCVKAAFAGNDLFPELVQNADKNGGGVSVNELKEYILINVPKITKDRQKPTTRRENIEVDWKLW